MYFPIPPAMLYMSSDEVMWHRLRGCPCCQEDLQNIEAQQRELEAELRKHRPILRKPIASPNRARTETRWKGIETEIESYVERDYRGGYRGQTADQSNHPRPA